MAKISEVEIPALLFDEQASAPTTPGTGLWKAYFKSDGIYVVDDAGAEVGPLSTGGAGSSTKTGGRVRRTTGQATITATSASVAWDTEDADSDGFFDVAGANPHLVTIPAGLGGDYRILWSWDWASNSTGIRIGFLSLNGTASPMARNDRTATGNAGGALFWEGALAAADTVQARVHQTSGGNLDFMSSVDSVLTIEKVAY